MPTYQNSSVQAKGTGLDNRTSTFSLLLNENTRVFGGATSTRTAGNTYKVNEYGVRDGQDIVRYRKQIAILKDSRTNANRG